MEEYSMLPPGFNISYSSSGTRRNAHPQPSPPEHSLALSAPDINTSLGNIKSKIDSVLENIYPGQSQDVKDTYGFNMSANLDDRIKYLYDEERELKSIITKFINKIKPNVRENEECNKLINTIKNVFKLGYINSKDKYLHVLAYINSLSHCLVSDNRWMSRNDGPMKWLNISNTVNEITDAYIKFFHEPPHNGGKLKKTKKKKRSMKRKKHKSKRRK